MTTSPVLTAPLSPADVADRVQGGVLEVVVVLDVLKLISAKTGRWIDLVAEAAFTSQLRSVHPLQMHLYG